MKLHQANESHVLLEVNLFGGGDKTFETVKHKHLLVADAHAHK